MKIKKEFYKEQELYDSVNLCARNGKVLSDSIGWLEIQCLTAIFLASGCAKRNGIIGV